MSKYAITFTREWDNWEATDTVIIEAESAEQAEANLGWVLNKVLGYDENDAGWVHRRKMYYTRNCDDVDYVTT